MPVTSLDALRADVRVRALGRAEPGGSLVRAPCSGVECIAYELGVWYSTSGVVFDGALRHEGTEERLLTERRGISFVIRADETSLFVPWDPRARVLLEQSDVFIPETVPPEWLRILARHGHRRDFGPREVRFTEKRLEVGSKVTVVGTAMRVPSSTGAMAVTESRREAGCWGPSTTRS